MSQPMCMLRDVASHRKGVVAASRFAEQSIIMEYKVLFTRLGLHFLLYASVEQLRASPSDTNVFNH